MSLQGFETEDVAHRVGNIVNTCIGELSRHIDLSDLDGITIGHDYRAALLGLDRGYETSHRLTPTEGEGGHGVAMAPRVKRGGKVKSHIVLSAEIAISLVHQEKERSRWALGCLAHECAHVEITSRFDAAFPGFLLGKAHNNVLDASRWDVILPCWEEFAANWISANLGPNRSSDDEDGFLRSLKSTQSRARGVLRNHHAHGDLSRTLREVFLVYGELMRFACYLLGTMRGRGLALDDLPKTKGALRDSWFAPHFVRLDQLCAGIADSYGTWRSQEPFEALGSLAQAIVAANGVAVTRRAGDELYVDVCPTTE